MISTLNSSSAIRDFIAPVSNNYTENELERMKLCGILFERKPNVNQKLINEFFRREPCLYNQVVYKNAARIFNCLKADLNENPILKTLKKQQAIERGEDLEEKQVTEVPKIEYEDGKEKKTTLQLAFSTLKFQKVLEDLLDECQFYGSYSQFKDEQSLVCTVLFDYMTRKFELRDKLLEEPFDNKDVLITEIENAIHKEKTDLAAQLAKNRIRADAHTIDELLPKELREVEQHRAELPLYCWVNQIKISVPDIIDELIENEQFNLVENKKYLDKKCFMVDPHCANLLMFHYASRDRIINSDYVKNYQLIVQDKSSCLAPYSVSKLLSKKDDVIITNLSGGLVAAFIGSVMEEYDGKVYVYGATNEDRYNEISTKLNQIGVSKYVKLVREDFMDLKHDDPRLDNAKVILINAPCSKSALMNPMEFLFQEGEDVKFLRDYTIDANHPSKIKKCIQDETILLKHALKFPKTRAIVYQTYSKHSAENEQLINRLLVEFNENRKSMAFPYKLSPPVISLTADDIQNDEVVKNQKFLQFMPSTRMNGSFIGILTRDRDHEVSKEMRRAEGSSSAKKIKKNSAIQPATFEEKNFLKPSSPKKLIKRKSSSPKKLSANQAFTALEEEIKQLQLRNKLDLPVRPGNTSLMQSKVLVNQKTKSTINLPNDCDSQNDFIRRLSLIGRLDSIGKIEPQMEPNRSSTPDEELNKKFSLNK